MPGRRLTLQEREDIAYLAGHHLGVRQIAAWTGRDPSTVSRELRRNVSPSPRRYRALSAHILAGERARRSRPRKLAPGTPCAPRSWRGCGRAGRRGRSRAG